MKYNRLELLLLGDLQQDNLDYQPLLKDYGVYLLSSTSFISYGKRLSDARKKEIIQKIANKEVAVYEESKYSDGYFNWWDCSYDETVVTFSFYHTKRGYEHEALPFIENSSSINYLPEFGLLEDGTILDKKQVQKLVSQIEEKRRVKRLESIAKYKYNPDANAIVDYSIYSFCDEHFGKIDNLDQLKIKFRELVNLHHPDKGGDEIMFKAIVAAKDYLKAKGFR